MENASKALIIAGAILIAILLISVGIIVMNSINEPIDQATAEATQQAVQMFNSKFSGYGGQDQRAASIKALLTAVNSSRGTDKGTAIQFTGTVDDVGDVTSGNLYIVNFNYDDEGYINEVEIDLQS